VAEEARDLGDLQREFAEQRLKGVGATDSAKVLGLSRWGSALTVYEEKLGLRPEREVGLPAWLGKKLQATVGELYTQATGIRVRAVGELTHFTSREHPWLVCHLDFRAWGNPRLIVETKTHRSTRGYGADGSNEIPVDEWVQLQHEMAVTRATHAHLAVLFGHYDFRVFPIERDDVFIGHMVPKLDTFWHMNVLAGVPPVASGFAGDGEVIEREHPNPTEGIKQASAEQELIVRRLKLARDNRLQAAAAEADAQNKVKQIIGSAEGIRTSFGTVTWRKDRDATSVAWQQVAEVWGRALDDVLELVAPGDDPELVKVLAIAQAAREGAVDLYTSVREGSRRFLPKFDEDE
jgi:predicted phage-related endonuclease